MLSYSYPAYSPPAIYPSRALYRTEKFPQRLPLPSSVGLDFILTQHLLLRISSSSTIVGEATL